MTLNEVDQNVTRSVSRTSTFSGSHKDLKLPSSSHNNGKDESGAPDVFSAGSGVLSMLKTTTELGDIGNIPLASNRFPMPLRPSFPHKYGSSNGPPPSRTSSHYSHGGSIKSTSSMHSARTHGSSRRMQGLYNDFRHAKSQEFQHPRSNNRSINTPESNRSMTLVGVPERLYQTDRSFSLTQTLPQNGLLSDQRSVSSLRSQGPKYRPHSPFMYPALPIGSGHRPSSPALSDTTGVIHNGRPRVRPSPGSRSHTTSSPLHSRWTENALSHQVGHRPSHSIRPHRTIEDLKRPFVDSGTFSGQQPSSDLPPYRSTRPPLGSAAQAHLGPPLPHFRAAPSPLYSNRAPKALDTTSKMSNEDAAPYRGFVQRVKNVLEERISSDENRRLSRPDMKSSSNLVSSPKKRSENTSSSAFSTEIAEDSASETPLFVPTSVKRLTRELIKAGVGAGSDLGASSELASDTSPGTLDDYSSHESQQSDQADTNSSKDSISKLQDVQTCQLSRSGEALRSSILAVVSRQNSVVQDLCRVVDTSESKSGLTDVNIDENEIHHQERLTDSNKVFEEEKHNDISDGKLPGRPQTLLVPSNSYEHKTVKKTLSRRSLPLKNESTDCSIGTEADVQHLGQTYDHSAHDRSKSLSEDFSKSTAAHRNSIFHRIASSRGSTDISMRPPSVATVRINSCNTNNEHRISQDSSKQLREGMEKRPQSMGNISAQGLSVPDQSVRHLSFEQDRCSGISSFPLSLPVNNDIRATNIRSYYAPLPDLTEDSQEDASTTNLRILGARPPVFRAAGRKPVFKDRRASPRICLTPEQPRSYLGRSLAETSKIPSFTFSKTDLTAKLNAALGLRSSRSLEEIRTKSRDIANTGSERPLSSTTLRERYTSFFSLEDDSTEDIDQSTDQVEKDTDQEDLITEINRLSIPSVNNLTERLSELLPSIKKTRSDLDLRKLDRAFHNTIRDLKDLGSEKRKSTEIQLDAFQSLDGASTAVTRRGTTNTGKITAEEKAVRRYGMLRLMKDLPPLPSETGEKRISHTSTASRPPRPSTALGNRPEPTVVPIMANTSPVKLKTLATMEKDETSSSRKQQLNKTDILLNDSPGDSFTQEDEGDDIEHGYELTSTKSSEPTPRPATASPIPHRQVRSARSASDPTYPIQDTIRIIRSMSPGPRFEASLVPKTDRQSTESKPSQKNRTVVGSIKRRMGLGAHVEPVGFPIDPIFLHPEERASVGPGDRYPVTGLTPPAGMTIDENRSFFSDDSSQHSAPLAGMRKRFTRFRPPKRSSNRQLPGNDSGSSIRKLQRDNGSIFDDSAMSQDHSNPFDFDEPAVGMSKAEFRTKRLIEKMRALWYKSSELFKHLNPTKKPQREVWYGQGSVNRDA